MLITQRVDELALHVVGKCRDSKKLAAHHRPHALVVEDRIHAAAAGNFRARQRRVPMLLRRRAVAHDALGPTSRTRSTTGCRSRASRSASTSACADRARTRRPRPCGGCGPHGVSTVVLIAMPSSMCKQAAVRIFDSCRSCDACRRWPSRRAGSTTRSALSSPSVSLSQISRG